MIGASHLALLRGINVGGKNKLPMNAVVEIFTSSGCKDVRTYIQSGNVIFNAPADIAAKVAVKVVAKITERFGFRTPVIVRSRAQLEDVIRGNPFLLSGVAEDNLHVMFLSGAPAPTNIGKLDPNRSPADQFRLIGQELYLHLPDGVANSKLTNAYVDSTLATIGTSRNWRTVTKLLKLMQGD